MEQGRSLNVGSWEHNIKLGDIIPIDARLVESSPLKIDTSFNSYY